MVNPDLKPTPLELVQTAPGHYEGTVDNAEARGNYFVNLRLSRPRRRKGIVTSGVSVPYSDEYRELKSNPANLETIASLTDGKVLSWKYRRDDAIDYDATLATGDVFRRDPKMIPPRGFQDLWPNLLWLACCLFLGDVAIRRVAPDIDRMKRVVRDGWERLRGREVAPPTEYMEKLRSRKAEVTDQLDRSRAATRFEPAPLPTRATPLDEPLLTGGAEPTRPEAARPPANARPGLGRARSRRRPRATPIACSAPSRRSGKSARKTRTSRVRDDQESISLVGKVPRKALMWSVANSRRQFHR